LCHFCNFTKLPKVNSHPLGEISPNPVTLTKYQKIPGANPTIARYNAGAVKFYNAASSLVRFENKNIFYRICKNALSLLQRWRCSC
jgi:hypothetical protein